MEPELEWNSLDQDMWPSQSLDPNQTENLRQDMTAVQRWLDFACCSLVAEY